MRAPAALWRTLVRFGWKADPFAAPAVGGPIADASGRVIRHGPIVTGAMLPADQGRNINGPSLIETPDWLTGRLGRYHLYFSSHRRARFVRLAYADQITGPWRIHRPGCRLLVGGVPVRGAVTSPELLVDEERRQLRMYLQVFDRQTGARGTFLALSDDGRRFTLASGRLGPAYGRVLRLEDGYYLFLGSAGQRVVRSTDGVSQLEQGPWLLRGPRGSRHRSRHVALQRLGDELRVFFTRRGDAPERILMTTIDLTADWRNWTAAEEEEVLRPQLPWEGADLPLRPSRAGAAHRRGENALRDPAIFESDGRTWLLYAYAGERGIALAELLF